MQVQHTCRSRDSRSRRRQRRQCRLPLRQGPERQARRSHQKARSLRNAAHRCVDRHVRGRQSFRSPRSLRRSHVHDREERQRPADPADRTLEGEEVRAAPVPKQVAVVRPQLQREHHRHGLRDPVEHHVHHLKNSRWQIKSMKLIQTLILKNQPSVAPVFASPALPS